MRLRRIIFKDGRAPITVLHTAQDVNVEGDMENLCGTLIRNAKTVAGYDEADARLDGYVVVGLFSNGKRSLSFRIPPRIPRELVPHYVAEMLRTDAICAKEAEDVFDDRFRWVE